MGERLPRFYFTPNSTDQAFRFGRQSAALGHARLTRQEFLSTSIDHPHPDSLWRAYNYGYTKAKKSAQKKASA